MIKGAIPRASTCPEWGVHSFKLGRLILRMVFFEQRKATTQTADTAWERMVARAAPCTPIPSPKMKMGSRMMLSTAPMRTVTIPVPANPWELMKAFIPRLVCTKRVPSR